MTTIDKTLALAVGHHQAGRLGEAGDLYYSILNERPDHADALHLLGIVAAQVGKPDLAVDLIGRAIAVDGTIPDFHASLSNALKALGLLDDAQASRHRAEALTAEAATARLRDGERLQAAGRLAEAAAAFAAAADIQPDLAAAHSRLGMVLWQMGRLEEAVARHHRAVALAPESPEMAVLLAIALNDQGRPGQAAEACRRALALNAGLAEAHVILGQSLSALGQPEAALASFRQAVAVRPTYAEGHKQLGAALKHRHRPLEAEACLRQSLGLDPRNAGTHLELANALLDQGRPEEAVAAYRRALELAPNHAVARGNLAYVSQFLPGVTLAELHRLHADWNDRHAAPFKAAGLPRRPIPAEPGGRLRLGFVSGDFRRHPVASFIIRVLENLDRGACAVTCYANQFEQDAMTERFQAAADLWRPVRGLSDDALAEQIRADGIDVLFDLTGHNARNRLGVFARRPAPLQAAWAGYMATTGLEAIDLLIADPRIVPEGAERFYVERVVRLPDSFIAYDPPADAPPVAPLPATARGGAVTFGSFNMLSKYNNAVVAAWAAILARLPTARLLLKTRGLDEPALRTRLAQRFAAHGIAPERLDLRGWSDQPGVLDYYGEVDIALDPFPFSGSTTTLEALWMGVPVLTLPGEIFASRHSLSYLTAAGITGAGITGMVADSAADYVERAVALAQDREGLAALRATLRPRMAASPLCDGKRFAEHLLEAVRGECARGENGEEH